MKKLGIAIDGPAGAGKSTIVELVAKELNIYSVNSGAIYRTIAYCILKNDLDTDYLLDMPEDELKLTLNAIDLKIEFDVNKMQFSFLNGEKIENDLLRNERIGNIASKLSANKFVRDKVTKICQEISRNEEVIMEGRDIGSIVLPNALLKIYLDADVKERAERRLKQLKDKGENHLELEKIINDMKERDNRDMNRDIAPLRKVEDAMVIDSTNLKIEEVVNIIIDEYRKRK